MHEPKKNEPIDWVHDFLIFAIVIVFGLLAVVKLSEAGGRRAPAPMPEPSPTVIPSPVPAVPVVGCGEKVYFAFGPNATNSLKPGGSDYAWGQKVVCAMNRAWNSGCMKRKVLAWSFQSLLGLKKPELKPSQKLEFYERIESSWPYLIDWRFYSKWGSTVGYTYNCKGGMECYLGAPSETYVWTNTRNLGATIKYAAGHLQHETSHWFQTGGFVHWSFHQGSAPYEIGDIMTECVAEQK